jgi:phage terminase large subunit
LIGRSKLKALTETTLNTFFQLSTSLGLSSQYKFDSQKNIIKWNNGSVILLKDLFLYPADPEFDSLGSLEITFSFIDECNQCTYKAWQVVKSRLRYKLRDFAPNGELTKDLKVHKYENVEGKKVACEWIQSDGVVTKGLIGKQLGTCNPAKNWTYSEFYNPSLNGSLKDFRKFIQALPKDNPHLPKSYIDNLMSMDTASRKRLLEGDWNYDDNPYAMFDYADILALFTSEWVKPTEKRYLSCDVAYTGSDKFVIFVWYGFVVVEIVAIDKIDDTLVSQKIHEIRIKHQVPIQNVVYDADGLQTFTRSSTKNGHLKGAKGFNNNGKPKKVLGSRENFKNLKSQCYFKFANQVKQQPYTVYVQETKYREQLIKELEQINRKPLDDDMLIALERKVDVRERLGRSPDFADAMMLRWYFELEEDIEFSTEWE